MLSLTILFVLGTLAFGARSGANAATLSVPSTHIAGQVCTITADGLTVGTDYMIRTANDGENITIVFSAIASKMYLDRSFEEDSDLWFYMKLWEYNGTAPNWAETAIDTIIVTQTEAEGYLNTDLFTSFLAPLVLIGVIALIVGGILLKTKK